MTTDPATGRPTTTGCVAEQADGAAILEAVFRAHVAALCGRLIGITRDPAAADDLLGECFLRLATEIDAGRVPLDPPAWLYRVRRNLAVSRARRTAVATRAMPGLLDRTVAGSPEDVIVNRERDELLHDALASLAGDDRQIVIGLRAARACRRRHRGRSRGR